MPGSARARYTTGRRNDPGEGDTATQDREEPSDNGGRGASASSPGFVGRERELAELTSDLAEAAAGRGRLVFVSGEPGIGKTRLADRVCGIAASRGSRVVWGRAWEGEGAPAFWPWVQVIRSLAEASTPEDLAVRLGTGASYVAQLAPELREKLPSIPPVAATSESEQARFYVFDATARFIKNVARSKPLVLVLDDLHWADKPSLLLLDFLARELRDARILVIGTYREAEARQAGPLAELLGSLARQGRHIPLGGLGEKEVALLAARTGGTEPTQELVSALHRATDGNPFFIDEIVRLLLSEGNAAHSAGNLPIPESVRAVIRRRLGLLPEESRSALSAASVVGRDFEARVLERACERPASEVIDSLAKAAAAGLVTRAQDLHGRYAFAHALIRETLYEDLQPAERLRLHHRTGEALEEIHRSGLEPYLAALAHHFGESAAEGDVAKAVDYATRAGNRAMTTLAYEEAVRHFERALGGNERSVQADDARLYDLLMALGTARFATGDYRRGREAVAAAAEHARRLCDPERLATAALGLRGRAYSSMGQIDEQYDALLEEALRMLPDQVTPLRARVLARLALQWLVSNERRPFKSTTEEAVRIARAAGDPSALAEALYARRIVGALELKPAERLAMARDVVRFAEEAGDITTEMMGRFTLIDQLFEMGDGEALDREVEGHSRRAGELKHEASRYVSVLVRAARAIAAGQLEEGEAFLAGILPRRGPFQTATRQFALVLFRLRFEQGRLGEIVDNVEVGADRINRVPAYRSALAATYAELGRESEARATFERLAARRFDDVPEDAAWFPAISYLSITCAFLRDSARAATLYDKLRPYAGRHITVVGTYLGPARYYLGMLATVLGRTPEAAEHFDDALTMASRMGARPFIARIQHAYAEMLLARGDAGDREKALPLVSRALRAAEEMGMKSLAERARKLKEETEDQRFATDRLGGGIFVGRERELGELRSALEEAGRGRGSLMLLSGEPGIGKSRLADRVSALANERGFQLAWGRAWEGEGAPPFWPWVQVLRSFVNAASPSELATQLGKGAPYVAQIAPEIAEKLPSMPAATTSPESEHARFYVFDAVTTFLKRASRSRPLLLVLDDLHWADKPSLLLLEFVARELRDARILVIGTYREAEARQASAVNEALGTLAREAKQIPLRGLSESDVAAFIERIGGHATDASLVAKVHQATDGNPFFVDEVVRLLAAEGTKTAGALPIPEGVRAALQRRLAALPRECAEVLTTASVLGRDFDSSTLERASGHSADALLDLLTTTTHAGLITRDRAATGRYSFAHALIRETLYEELNPAVRARLHREIGAILEGIHVSDLDAHAAQLAHHFIASGTSDDAPKALDYSGRAGRRAMSMLAYEEAAEHSRRALDLLPRGKDESLRCDLLLLLGEALMSIGNADAAKQALLEAAEVARELGESERFAQAALEYGRGLFGIMTKSDPQHVRLLEAALDGLGKGDPPLRARIMIALAAELVFVPELERAKALTREALEIARATGDRRALASALEGWLFTSARSGKRKERITITTEALRLAEEAGDRELVLLLMTWNIWGLLGSGDLAAADREIDAYEDGAKELRQPNLPCTALLLRAMRSGMSGRFEEAERSIIEAFEIAHRFKIRAARATANIALFALRREQGRLAELVEFYDSTVRNYGLTYAWRSGRSLMLAELGRDAEARREFEALSENDFALGSEAIAVGLTSVTTLSEVCWVLGDSRRASILYDLMLRRSDDFSTDFGGVYCRNPTSHYLGLLATTLGRHGDAERHFEDALAKSATMEAPPWAARTQYHYADMLLRRGGARDREKALSLLTKSLATAETLGMAKLAADARALRDSNEEQRFATDRLGGGIFVDREREVSELRAALDEAEGGRGALFLLSGEPGIGKSRVADRLGAIAAGRGFRVLWGRAWEGEGAPAFWPWVQILRGLAEAATPGELASQLGNGASYVAQLLPELHETLPSMAAAPTSPDSEHARFYLFDAASRFLKTVARSKPLVLVLDDLHWADKPSLLLLEHVAHELRGSRMLIIGTYREAEARRAGPLAETLGSLSRESRHVPLGGLGEDDVALFMEQIGLTKPDAALVSAVYRTTDGNPFFVDEIVRLLAAEGMATANTRTLPIPESVRAVIRRRLALLQEEPRRVLSIASVIGNEFDLAILERATDRTSADLIESLARAVTAGLTARSSAKQNRYGFAHALVRETLYEDLAAGERQRLHLKIGEAIEELHALDLDPRLAELANHFLRATLGGDATKALDYSRRAGERSMTVHAYEEAVGHLERALELLSTRAADETERCRLLVALGRAQSRAGRVKESRETLRRGADLARKHGLPEELALAALESGRRTGWDPARGALLEEALAALPEADSALRATLLSEVAYYDHQSGLGLAGEAAEMARRLGDKTTLARALVGRLELEWLLTRVTSRSRPPFEESRLIEEPGDLELSLALRAARIRAFLVLGDIAGARTEIEAYCRIAEALRQPFYLGLSNIHRGSLATLEGRFEDAERWFGQAAALRGAGGLALRQAVAASLFLLRLEQGRLEELVDYVDTRAGAFFPGQAAFVLESARALVLVELGREAEARSTLEGLTDKFAELALFHGWDMSLHFASEVCTSLGDRRHASIIYGLLLPLAGEAMAGSTTVWGAVTHSLALLASTLSRFEEAERHFEDALAFHRRMGAPPLMARTQYHWARMLIARAQAGDRARARSLLADALRTAEEIGMRKVAADVRTLLVSIVPATAPGRGEIPLAAAADDTVTLMFSDMSGFTEMTERLGDEAALEVVQAHNAIVRRELAAHGGRELELQGDGFLLSFPAAKVALRCAVAVQRAFATYSAEHPARPIGVKIGIHSGEPIRQGDRYFGRAVILVTRIAGQAKSGEILASSVVRDLGEGARDVVFDEGREIELKGISVKQRVFRVRWSDEERDEERGQTTFPIAETLSDPIPEMNVFRREGDYWTIACEGRSFRLKDAKGLRYLGELLHNPGREFAALDLARSGQDGERGGPKTASEGVADLGDAGPLLDAQAKTEYRRRLEDLREELEEAERFNDPERASRAREEIEALSEELSRATGLGGRDRKAGSAAERARLNVTMAIKSALKRIADNDATLGRHLAMTVKTGNFCSYVPDPRSPIAWGR